MKIFVSFDFDNDRQYKYTFSSAVYPAAIKVCNRKIYNLFRFCRRCAGACSI